jgi:hypothetical protein
LQRSWAVAFLLWWSAVCFAQEQAIPSLTIPRVTRPPKLADFLNGTPREAELVVTDFRQFDPGDGVPVSQPTTAYLSYDDKHIYAAFVAKDDPRLIRANIAKRKQILTDDRVTINIDTFHDHIHAYWFDVNPYAIQLDGVTTDGVGDDFSWEGVWGSESKITGDGYVVLITVPFKTIRFPDAEKQQWGVLLGRFIQRNNEFATWPYVTRRKLPRFVAQFGTLEGIEGISPGRHFQLIPYGLVAGSRYLDQPVNFPPQMITEPTYRAGVDGKAVIRDALTLDMTVNPDFSQVESDEPQVTVNQRYEVFFPEKRPFFMDNASYFTTPENLFFSRRIIDPEYGARLTGKLGRWAIGVLATDDRAPGKAVAPDDPLYGDRATNGVLSVQRDLLKDSHIRLFATDSEFGPAYNRVGSLDTRLGLRHGLFLTGQAATSMSRSTEGEDLSGNDYFVRLANSGRTFQYYTSYTDVSPGFRADLGYVPRIDIRQVKNRVGYKWWRDKKTLVNFGPAVIALGNWNRTGQVQDWEVAFEWSMEFTRLTALTITRSEAYELYNGYGFRKGTNNFLFTTEWFKWLAATAQYSNGDGMNYYPATGYHPFAGRGQNANLGLTFRPTARLRLDESYLYSHLGGSVNVYTNHIARSKVNYQFTRELSLRAIVDYNGVLPNTAVVQLDRTKRFGYDLLLTYLVHPGTALYVGYTDIYQNYLFDPSRPPYLQYTNSPEMNTGRQIFVKLSYLFRL